LFSAAREIVPLCFMSYALYKCLCSGPNFCRVTSDADHPVATLPLCRVVASYMPKPLRYALYYA